MAKLILRRPTWRKKAGEEIEAVGEAADSLVRHGHALPAKDVKKAAQPKS
jgi:hypothetical protein